MYINKIKTIAEKYLLKDKSTLPFEVSVQMGIDASKIKPYYVKPAIIYGDKIFKKRMFSIIKEEKYLLIYEFNNENVGSFFKPVYKQVLNIHITKRVMNTSTLLVLDILTLGVLDYSLIVDENVIKVNNIDDRMFTFKTDVESKLFAEKIQYVLNYFLKVKYEEYRKLI